MSEIKCIGQASGKNWHAFHGDCIEVSKGLPDNSIDYSVFSPPFAQLYTFSNSERDVSNNDSDEAFWGHFGYLIKELYRVIKPGRLCSIHCMNMPSTKQWQGYIGIRDFRGDAIRAFCGSEAAEIARALFRLEERLADAQRKNDVDRIARLAVALDAIKLDLQNCPPSELGFIYHSEVAIWKDPVTAMQRTKALGLLHKQLVKDSSMSRQGIADYILNFVKPNGHGGVSVDPSIPGDATTRVEEICQDYMPSYVVTFRKDGENAEPIQGKLDHFAGDQSTFRQTRNMSIDIWQRYASPIWTDIQQGNTLQFRAAREESDERHISPLQLDVIERCIQLWTNPGDVVYSPFGGIGSEGYQAVMLGRKSLAVELKKSYFDLLCSYMEQAEENARQASRTLFAEDQEQDDASDFPEIETQTA
jgi:DNA modification methylase